MDRDKKEQLDAMIEREIREGRIPGFLIGTKTEKAEEVFSYGLADAARGVKIERDTIFRLYSMSKPICAVAVWILIERGKLSLDGLLSDFLPEFHNMVRYQDHELVPVQNPVKIRDLLNMTAGFTYDDEDPAGQRTGELFAVIHQAMDEGKEISTREVMKMLAGQPLADEPGKHWRYGLCADVLGAVVETVDGRRLRDFYKEEIFDPLGMKDTGFYVPKEKQVRFAPLFRQKVENGKCVLEYDKEHHLGLGNFLTPPSFESAGAGLVSTYDDYMKFAWMLAGGGELAGVRILKKETVDRFAENQLTDRQTKGIYFEHMQGYGYGNLMRVCLDGEQAYVPGIKHAFGWDGWCGPYMMVDRRHKEVLLFFIQIAGYANWELTAQLLRLLLFR